jgi:HPt (histidine-containing phosphotransfer) domain-containing protein
LHPCELTLCEADNATHRMARAQHLVNQPALASGASGKKGATMIDWSRLNALRTDIGEADFHSVTTLFMTEIAERLAILRADPAAATAEDFHFLRGSAANLGLSAMVAFCHAGEAACRSGDAPDVAAVADAFAAAMEAIILAMPELASAA